MIGIIIGIIVVILIYSILGPFWIFVCIGIFFVLKQYNQRIKPGHNHLTIFFGIPGSGKTTLAAAFARKYIKKGFTVMSNVPIKGCLKYSPSDDLGVVNIQNCLVILDEAAIEFNNRNYKSFPKNCIAFFKLHRHYKTEIIVFSQSWNDCDITLRRLAYQYYLVRPSLIPYFIQACPIRRKIGINETTNQPDDIYSFYPVLLRPWHNRMFFAPLAWKLFDSWEAPILPQKEFESYGEIYDNNNQRRFLGKYFPKQKGGQGELDVLAPSDTDPPPPSTPKFKRFSIFKNKKIIQVPNESRERDE